MCGSAKRLRQRDRCFCGLPHRLIDDRLEVKANVRPFNHYLLLTVRDDYHLTSTAGDIAALLHEERVTAGINHQKAVPSVTEPVNESRERRESSRTEHDYH